MSELESGKDFSEHLRTAGLKPTRQRLALAELLFSEGHRHVSAEDLHAEIRDQGIHVSLATVYNTLHQFTSAGMLREVSVDGAKAYFDTNTHTHHHFFVEGENRIIDMPGVDFDEEHIPDVPEGMEVVRVDVVVRLRAKEEQVS